MEYFSKKDVYAAFDFNVCDIIEFDEAGDSVGGFSREAVEDILSMIPTFYLPDA